MGDCPHPGDIQARDLAAAGLFKTLSPTLGRRSKGNGCPSRHPFQRFNSFWVKRFFLSRAQVMPRLTILAGVPAMTTPSSLNLVVTNDCAPTIQSDGTTAPLLMITPSPTQT